MDNFRRRTSESCKIKLDPITGRGMIGDYEVVDLGLPSGLLWATWNVGATNESEYGNYYQWGAGAETYKNENQYHTGGIGSSYTLPSSADTATQVMGEGWRMPTLTELQELINNTTYKWVTINGIKGGKFTSKTNPNAYAFFLPLADTNLTVSMTKIIVAFIGVLRLLLAMATTWTFTVRGGERIPTIVTTDSLCAASILHLN